MICVTFVPVKRLPLVILVLLVLGAVVPGCGGAHRYDGRLTAVDSLLRSEPDSALALVQAVSRDNLPDEGDRAYRDLLLTQARYRCYVTATSDSDINRALAWFSAHPSDREKLTRAYIYKGAVMEELGHPDSAMFYYKTAEATAAPDDYYNLGYSNMRIAQLYQSHFVNDSAVVSRMKTASFFFESIPDTNYLITTIGTQGAYLNIIGFDSACICLEKAIMLSKKINSPKGLQYQSKLAGTYFYNGNYQRSKELAMEIVKNESRDLSNEKTFYYYAARSFLRLCMVDSARLILSIIPVPDNSVDSMSYYQTLAELSQATHHYEEYKRYSEAAHKIDTRLYESSNVSKLTENELKWDADQLAQQLKDDTSNKMVYAIGFSLLSLILVLAIANKIIKSRNILYQNKLCKVRRELETSIEHINKISHELESERVLHQQLLVEKGNELTESIKRCNELEDEKTNIATQVSSIVRFRHAALNEIYQSMRIKTSSDDDKKHHLPMMGTIKELYEKRGILRTPLKKSFWDNLRKSVDGEFMGIVTFVEKNYPSLTDKDLQLFMLACADFPNPIIKICMTLTSDVTVSKKKKKLMKEKLGLDVKLDVFIQMYLDGIIKKRQDI